MNYSTIDEKWQKRWEDTGLYRFNPDSDKPKKYMLEMFSYPSGAKLHLGHWYNYSLADSYARWLRMTGNNVFHPMGFDAFGLPAENYAIKTGIHPKDSTLQNIETMEKQLRRIGGTWDWDYELVTCSPEYYKWTQWCFLQLYKNGLAYRKDAPVNWCPSCNTVLANEQVIDGECERCGTPVVRKHLTQWFFRITKYAEELLDSLSDIDWPEKTKTMQRNWIGKSTGSEIAFRLADSDEELRVFTTRADTLYGCTYIVMSPEHPLLDKLTKPEQKDGVEEYKAFASRASEIDRLSTTREKTGEFTGSYAINPINGRRIPIWTADYVLATYGTGVVMAVPAHDERDFEFATRFDLPIERVVVPAKGEPGPLPYTDYGVLVNSGLFTEQTSEEAKKSITEELEKDGHAEFRTNYRLRDWLISRQRYWGAPIPMVYCEHCGEVPVPEDQLPVELPYNVDFRPEGESPLASCAEFVDTVCPKCGRPAKRDVDTMDTFVCSSWYYLRYPDNRNDLEAWNKDIIDSMLPVDQYVGGAEHAVMHLLYSRFFTKAFRDMGCLSFDEPFKRLVHQGTILGTDGEKMSKSRGNIVSPDEYVNEYGSDTMRIYLAFGFNYVEGGPWNDHGIRAANKFLERVERITAKAIETEGGDGTVDPDLNYVLNSSISRITRDMPQFSFNTAIARIMELTNALYKYAAASPDGVFFRNTVKQLILLLSPFAPHFCEEMWERLGGSYSIFDEPYPTADESALKKDVITLSLQVNGKMRGRFDFAADGTPEQLEDFVLAEFSRWWEGKEVKKVIIVPGRLVNVVAK